MRNGRSCLLHVGFGPSASMDCNVYPLEAHSVARILGDFSRRALEEQTQAAPSLPQ